MERVVLDREQNVDIDDDFDLWLAGEVLRKRSQVPGRTFPVPNKNLIIFEKESCVTNALVLSLEVFFVGECF